jgi:hypothetical protein
MVSILVDPVGVEPTSEKDPPPHSTGLVTELRLNSERPVTGFQNPPHTLFRNQPACEQLKTSPLNDDFANPQT